MTAPYTYLLKCIPENKFYYGVRYAYGCSPSDFWNTYFTSSKHIHELINKYGKSSFVFEIRKIFDTEKHARLWERTVIKRMNMVLDDKFINKSCPGDNFGFATGKNNPMANQDLKKIMMINKTKSLIEKYGVDHNSKIDSFRENISLTMSKTNSTIVQCPHCGKNGGHINMKRYHYDNCKKIKE
jgi:hypothetical protein